MSENGRWVYGRMLSYFYRSQFMSTHLQDQIDLVQVQICFALFYFSEEIQCYARPFSKFFLR